MVGEIIPGKEFYDYEAKYLSEGSVPVIPAKIEHGRERGRFARWPWRPSGPAICPAWRAWTS